jgi:hypothetical protein
MEQLHRLAILLGLFAFVALGCGCNSLDTVNFSNPYQTDLEPGRQFVADNLRGTERESWQLLVNDFDQYIAHIREHGYAGASADTMCIVINNNDDYGDQADDARHQLIPGVADVMADSGIWSRVRVSTEIPGARIKYRLIGRGLITTSPELTNDVFEEMPIGYYKFWSERDGFRTGVLDIVRVVDEEFEVVITESLP